MTVRIELRAPGSLRRADPAPVTVVLTNDGPGAVVVNHRMAPGYVESVSREVFLDVDGEYGRRKYERDPPSPADFARLEPGASVTAEFDLLGWYRMRSPGTYRFTPHYQCDEPFADAPDGVLRGVIDGPPVTIAVG